MAEPIECLESCQTSKIEYFVTIVLREKCLYSELSWSECRKKWSRKTPNTDTFDIVKAKSFILHD